MLHNDWLDKPCICHSFNIFAPNLVSGTINQGTLTKGIKKPKLNAQKPEKLHGTSSGWDETILSWPNKQI